jgi:micrococcal nuclease
VLLVAACAAAACGAEAQPQGRGAQTTQQPPRSGAQATVQRPRSGQPSPLPSSADAQRLPCTVARVTDGDTIRCREGGRRVRLLDIDAPELAQRPHGDAARRALARLVPEGARVALEPGPRSRDRYGRTLAYVWASDTLLVNLALVRAGYALRYDGGDPGPRAAAIAQAETAARAASAGLWGTGGFRCAPSDHRRGRC